VKDLRTVQLALRLTFPFLRGAQQARDLRTSLWSWWADQKMVAMMLLGKMGEEVKRVSEDS
jgi:hypothetical protein